MDWYCAEYKELTLYELHNGKTAVGLEDLDELLMRTIDPNLAAEVQQLNDKDHAAWMQELRKQQTFRERTTQNRVITVRRIDAQYIHETTTWPTSLSHPGSPQSPYSAQGQEGGRDRSPEGEEGQQAST